MACPQTGPLQGEGPSLVGLSGRRGHTQGQAQNGERPWGPCGSVLWGNGGWFVTEEGHMGTEGRLPPDPFPVYSSVTSHVAASFPPLLMELSTVVLHRWDSARTCCSSRRLLGNEPPRTARAGGWARGGSGSLSTGCLGLLTALCQMQKPQQAKPARPFYGLALRASVSSATCAGPGSHQRTTPQVTGEVT